MKPAKSRIEEAPCFEECELLALELQVAKRADKLWKMAGCCRGRDLVHWLQAESEVLDRYFAQDPSSGPVLAAAH
jgi:hypothetical protein